MNVLGRATQLERDQALAKTWLFSHQVTAFSPIVYTTSTDTISTIYNPLAAGSGYTKADLALGIKVEGEEFTKTLLNLAFEYFQKGLFNFVAQYILASQGMATWASVTNYYSSFFTLHSLLCLQGQAITRFTNGSGKTSRCLIAAINITTHEYLITEKGLGRHEHGGVWKRFYETYDTYIYRNSDYEKVYKKAYVSGDLTDESDERNKINYRPFEGFNEAINQVKIDDFKGIYNSAISTPSVGKPLNDYLAHLNSLATDPDFKYFARSILRLLFIADVIKQLSITNVSLKTEWTRRLPLWKQSCLNGFSDPPTNFFESA
jgi:hypothetical protein